LLVLSALFGVACKSDYPASGRQATPGNKTAAREVKTVPVSQTPVGETVTVNGTLAAYDQTTVSVKVPGRLQSISVDLGSVVRRGQSIARLETSDYKLRV
jgi:multidrug efflux pump subunit AcrA (membrane-fusion protein)